MRNQLYRSRTDLLLGGVCGGLGQYLGINSTLIRIFFVLLTLGSGIGIGVLIYLLLWIVIPRQGQGEVTTVETIRSGADEVSERVRTLGDTLRAPNPQARLVIGGSLLVLGVILLVQTLDIVWLRWLNLRLLGALLIIAFGAALIRRSLKGD
jgi:phage shock protein C